MATWFYLESQKIVRCTGREFERMLRADSVCAGGARPSRAHAPFSHEPGAITEASTRSPLAATAPPFTCAFAPTRAAQHESTGTSGRALAFCHGAMCTKRRRCPCDQLGAEVGKRSNIWLTQELSYVVPGYSQAILKTLKAEITTLDLWRRARGYVTMACRCHNPTGFKH